METKISSLTKEVIIGPDHPVVIIGERINPTGRKKLARSLEQGDLSLLQQEALRQVAAGAQVLDVNVGISGGDESALMIQAIKAISDVTDVPLCIDSAKPEVLAAGLSVYKGKALVNSANGEESKIKEVLPIVARYKAAVVCLTMDDKGIPSDVPTRMKIGDTIVNEATKLGIPLEDIIIDPLAMSVSADDRAGLSALKALAEIKKNLGVNQTIGASNVSFGLPDRAFVNGVFLAMAIMKGLTCPITDPTNWTIRETLLLTDLMLGKDEFSMNFISGYRDQHPEED
ncbi:MAG: dihydropteroate synthase [Desulfobacula sp.]|jgi:5-methyltetrahydrofolate--homocysteine methyltransferase|uniref:dihydropteroate synthase n=1 Tax=Desulfobacula sp. TaxID=2593537 RepID=UPI001D64DC99|nr:dihydropteroate synthase [Desulfobacula sp.]MBT3484367.1 dihydropteroate synthase [Desulfobacula sp.]MBT3806703.1 dihydropteroate synthase [Desulfobacula sp.]MBT4024176.1 dihydropteroate synthase [Desulfobacula sp.]MBT4197405.1 dihydropteroate synthase [Desulfobacula sp.]